MVVHRLIPLTHCKRPSGVNGEPRYLVVVGDGDGEFDGVAPQK